MSEASNHRKLTVEVAYAKPDDHRILTVEVEQGTSVFDAAKASGMQEFFPEIVWEEAKLGVFGKAVLKADVQEVRDGDRIEIYRPLIADPKEVRKKRAEQARQKRVEA